LKGLNVTTDRKSEVANKLKRLRERLAQRQYDSVLLNQTANTSWITAGAATYVNEASDGGPSSILVTTDNAYALTDVIEGPRLKQEEQLESLGFAIKMKAWHSPEDIAQSLTGGKRIARESDFGTDLRELRSVFQPEELERLRRLGKLAGEAMDDAVRSVRPGASEYELAARLAAAGRVRGGSPIVNLIASDERIYNFRHPLPTAKTVDKYAMLVLCLRMEGLIVSVTRLVHFGPMPDELRKRAAAVARIDAKMILGTQAGRTMGDIFALAKEAYAAEGHPESIEEHHQGGSAGYMPREVFAVPGDTTPILVNQAFAWNPSISGAKSEDTVLLSDKGIEVLTAIPGWPVTSITVNDKSIDRPEILSA
jgi:antitoxin VapB